MSVFTDAWRKAIEASEISVSSWAIRIGTETEQLESWLAETQVPDADCLRLFVTQLQQFRNQAAYQDFYRVLNKRSWKVTPLWREMRPSIGHWMLEEFRQSLRQALATLPFELERQILVEAITACRERRPDE